MKKALLAGAAVAACAVASPAQAVTFIFTGGAGTTQPGSHFIADTDVQNATIFTLTARGATYSAGDRPLGSESAFSQDVRMFQGEDGVSVCPAGEGLNCAVVDNDGMFEAIKLTLSPGLLTLSSLLLTNVGGSEAIDIFGLGTGGALVHLGVAGSVVAPTPGLGVSSFAEGNGWRVNFDATSQAGQSQYGTLYLAARGDTDTFSLAQVEGGVPEPTTWAMMLIGFGAVGYAFRRRPKHRLAQAV